VAIAPANVAQPFVAALVLGRVVQERADRLVLRAAVLEHQTGPAQQMRDERATAPRLLKMQPRGVPQRIGKALAEDGRVPATCRVAGPAVLDMLA